MNARHRIWHDFVAERCAEFALPSVAAAVVRDGDIEWFGGFGEAELGAGSRPTEHSRYRIASNTKPFTALMLLVMSDASMLSLDDPLLLHLPEFTSAATPVGDLEDVTLRRLATHHAGLVTEHPQTDWSRAEFPDMTQALDTIDTVSVVLQPDTQWKYSNLAYGLLGEVISRLSGADYSQTLSRELLTPLAMLETAASSDAIPESDHVVGYLPAAPGTDALRTAPNVELRAVDSAGALWSSVADLAKWFGAMTSDDIGASGIAVSPRTLDEMLRPAYISRDWSMAQCLGWRAVRSDNHVYHGHGGGIHGFGTATLWCRATRTGVIVLTSLWPSLAAGTIARQLLDMVTHDLSEPPADPEAPSADPTLDAASSSLLAHRAGTYVAEPGLRRTVTAISDGVLHLGHEPSATLGRATVTAVRTDDPTRFAVSGGRGAGENLVFVDDETFTLSNFTYRRTHDD